MKLFVDDERHPPVGEWEVIRNADDAIERMTPPQAHPISVLSLDHDLGENVPTGYDVAAWLEEQVYTGQIIPPRVLKVHSANPVGRARILQTFQSIARYCERNGIEIPKIEG